MAVTPMTVHSIRSRWSLARLWSVGLALYLIAMQFATGTHAIWLADAGWTFTAAVACGWCFHAARLVEPAARRAWRLLGCGCLSWLIGQLHWDYARLVQGIELPFPSVSHVFYTGFAVFMMLGVRQLPQLRQPVTSGGRQVGNIALVTLCLAVILMLGMVGPALRADLAPVYLGGGLMHTAVVCGAFLITLHALWTAQWHGRWAGMLMLVVATGLYALSTIIYTHALLAGSYLPTDLVNMGWLAMFGLVACAAHEQVWSARPSATATTHDRSSDWHWLQSVVPAVLVIIMAIVAVSSAATLTPTVVPWAVAMFIVLALLMGIRQAAVQRDHRALTRRLWIAGERFSCEMPLQSSEMALDACIGRFRTHVDAQRVSRPPVGVGLADSMIGNQMAAMSTRDAATPVLVSELLQYLAARSEKYLHRAERGELDLSALLDDLLRHYIGQDGVGAPVIKVDLSSLIERVLRTSRNELHHCRIGLRCDQHPILLHSRVGEFPLALALQVLLSAVLNGMRDAPSAHLDIQCSLDDGHVVLVVSGDVSSFDTPHHRQLLASSDCLQDASLLSGAGLELALMSRAVQRMAGTVRVSAMPGQTARVVIELPDLGNTRIRLAPRADWSMA